MKAYFYVEAEKQGSGSGGELDEFEGTVFTEKTEFEDQMEAIWLHVYRAMRPLIGDSLKIVTCKDIDVPESADAVT